MQRLTKQIHITLWALLIAACVFATRVPAQTVDTIAEPAVERTTPAAISATSTAAPATGTLPAGATGSATAPIIVETPPAPDIVIQNDYIKILVNDNEKDRGRFSLHTVGGDPARRSDDKQMLIYGRKTPWTSFTTVWIDGIEYVFGGKTERRAGLDAAYGDVVEPPHVAGNSIITSCRMGGVLVTQILSIVNGPISQQPDTMKISYQIENRDTRSHDIGLRVVIDTLLGGNDGAPFRVRDQRVLREARVTGADVPSYWIAFDMLDNPRVISRGTLRGMDLMAPDRVWFSNWGKLADNPWSESAYALNQSFIRKGERAPDSAIAMKWNPMVLGPGGSRSFNTMYGIEYLNISEDLLRIGTLPHLGSWPTAPAQLRSYTLYAYITNTLDFDMDDVEIRLELPDGVTLAGDDDGVRTYRVLKAKDEVIAGWELQPEAFSGDDAEHEIIIRGKSGEQYKTKVATKVILLRAPEVKVAVEAPEELKLMQGKKYGPENPFPVTVRCINDGLSPIENIKVTMELPPGMQFPSSQKPTRSYPRLEGKDEAAFLWKILATGEADGNLPIRVTVTSDSAQTKEAQGVVLVPPLGIKLEWQGVPESAPKGEFLAAEVFVYNLADFNEASFDVEFNPNVVDVIRVSQGTAFVENRKASLWSDPEIDNRSGVVRGISGNRGGNGFDGHGSLATIHLRTRGPGDAGLRIKNLKLADTAAKPIHVNQEEAVLEVMGKGGAGGAGTNKSVAPPTTHPANPPETTPVIREHETTPADNTDSMPVVENATTPADDDGMPYVEASPVKDTPAAPLQTLWRGAPDSLQPDETFTLELLLPGVSDLNIAEMEIEYDHAILEIQDVLPGEVFQGGLWSEGGVAQGRIVGIRGDRGGNGFSGDGVLLKLNIKTLKPGKADVRVSRISFADTLGRVLPAGPGTISVTVEEQKDDPWSSPWQ